MTTSTIPIWLQPQKLNDWQTKTISDDRLHYNIGIKSTWNDRPEVISNGLETEHVFMGEDSGELLSISLMENAIASHDLSNWIKAFISLVGFPNLHLPQAINPPPQLIQWQELGDYSALNQKLNVEETFLFTGLAQSNQLLIRLYILLARRENWAWKINLCLPSACLPDAPAELLDRSDHFRAGAIFAELKLG